MFEPNLCMLCLSTSVRANVGYKIVKALLIHAARNAHRLQLWTKLILCNAQVMSYFTSRLIKHLNILKYSVLKNIQKLNSWPVLIFLFWKTKPCTLMNMENTISTNWKVIHIQDPTITKLDYLQRYFQTYLWKVDVQYQLPISIMNVVFSVVNWLEMSCSSCQATGGQDYRWVI